MKVNIYYIHVYIDINLVSLTWTLLLLKRSLKASLVHILFLLWACFHLKGEKKNFIYWNRSESPDVLVNPVWMTRIETKLWSLRYGHISLLVFHIAELPVAEPSFGMLLEFFGGWKCCIKSSPVYLRRGLPVLRDQGEHCGLNYTPLILVNRTLSPWIRLLCPFWVTARGWSAAIKPLLGYDPHCNLSGPISRAFQT